MTTQWEQLTEVDAVIDAVEAGRQVEFTANSDDDLNAPPYDPDNHASGGWIPFTYTDRIPLRRLMHSHPMSRFRVLRK